MCGKATKRDINAGLIESDLQNLQGHIKISIQLAIKIGEDKRELLWL